jgi:hypothetical protein
MESAVSSQGEHISSLESVVSSQQDDIAYLMDLNQEGEVNMKKLAQEMDELRQREIMANGLAMTDPEPQPTVTIAPETEINNPKSIIQNPDTDISDQSLETDLLTKLTERLNALEGLVLGMQDELPEPFIASSSSNPTSLIDNPISNIQNPTSSIENIEATVSAELVLLETNEDIDDILNSKLDLDLSAFIATSSADIATNSAYLNTYLSHQLKSEDYSKIENQPSIINSLSITTDLLVGSLAISGTTNSISTLSSPLLLQTSPLAGNIEAFNRKIVLTNSGDIEIVGTLTAQKVKTAEIEADKAVAREAILGKVNIATTSAELDRLNTITSFNLSSSEATESANGRIGSLAEVVVAKEESPSIGTGTIKLTRTKAFIQNTSVTKNSKVFITPLSVTTSPISVIDVKPGIGFIAAIPTESDQEIEFNYWIIN